jgi:hypothetical protein
MKILNSILELTRIEHCQVIGSTSGLIARGTTDDENVIEGIHNRDIDIIQTRLSNVESKLNTIGTLILIKSNKAEYGTPMFDARNIASINTYEFKLGNNTAIGRIISNLHKSNYTVKLDIITLTTDSIMNATNYWPISETKRNWSVFKDNSTNSIVFTELKTIPNKALDLSAKTICNAIETFKHIVHLYGSTKLGYTKSGDKLIREKFDTKKLHFFDTLQHQKKINDLMNGISIELIKPIEIPLYKFNELQNICDDECCPVCQEELKVLDNKFIKLKCTHIFCVGCIFPMWIKYLIMRSNRLIGLHLDDEDGIQNHNNCPVCRESVFKINSNQKIRNSSLNVDDYLIEFTNIDTDTKKH